MGPIEKHLNAGSVTACNATVTSCLHKLLLWIRQHYRNSQITQSEPAKTFPSFQSRKEMLLLNFQIVLIQFKNLITWIIKIK